MRSICNKLVQRNNPYLFDLSTQNKSKDTEKKKRMNIASN